MSGTRLSVGYITGAHGIRGGLRVKLHNAGSHAFTVGSAMMLVREGDELGRFEIAKLGEVPGKPDELRIRLAGVDDRTAAEALRGCDVQVDRDELPALEPGEFYLADAIGLPVRRRVDDHAPPGLGRAQAQELGTIVAVTTNGAQELFEVEHPAGTWLLPILPGFVLDVTAEHVLVDVPPGMLPDALE
jgi:16S rRNA processing protein RimM